MSQRFVLCLSLLFAFGCQDAPPNSAKAVPVVPTPLETTTPSKSSLDVDAVRPAASARPDYTKSGEAAMGHPYLPSYAKGPVATVDNIPIPARAFNQQVKRLLVAMNGKFHKNMMQMYHNKLVRELVDQSLLQGKAESLGVKVSDAEVNAFGKGSQQGKSIQETQLLSQLTGVKGEVERKEVIRRELLVQKMLAAHYMPKITDQEVRKRYQMNKNSFNEEATVQASHILIKVEKEASKAQWREAKKRMLKIAKLAREKDADFAAIAKQYSEGPSASRGGDLGFFPARRMVKPFAKAAFATPVGKVSRPVKTRFGWHLVKVFDKKPARTFTFESAKDKVRSQMEQANFLQAKTSLIKTLRLEHDIELHMENIVVDPSWDRQKSVFRAPNAN